MWAGSLFEPLAAQAPRFEITFARSADSGRITGRLILVISKTDKPEPRLRVSLRGPALFGKDLEGVKPDQVVVLDGTSLGYPAPMTALAPGDYFAQAIIDRYTLTSRADGHGIWVRVNHGKMEPFNVAAGNLYSDVRPFRLGRGEIIRLTVSHVIPPLEPPPGTEWLKHVRIQSEKLTSFWGRPVYINATVLLPRGYRDHPDVRYPAVYAMGHGPRPFRFTTDSTRAQSGWEETEIRRGAVIGRQSGMESGYDFYRSWNSDGFPRVIAVSFEQQTPYFPDSYSLNSANNGPYGDAIVEEVIPHLEQRFRMLSKPYARHVEGASTGGWQALALNLRYPDFFGGAWVLQPDPIDFSRYQITDIYQADNAFEMPLGEFLRAERYYQRTSEGQPLVSVRQASLFEQVLGSHGRSGHQLNAWEALYGPVGADGYPVPLWDQRTGKIDHAVAGYMRDQGYDLLAYTKRSWATLGPKLVGKLHFFAGDMDDYYLNLGVYRFEEFLKTSTNPHYEGEFTYGRPMKGHAWHSYTWAEMIRLIAIAAERSAPPNENSKAWHY